MAGYRLKLKKSTDQGRDQKLRRRRESEEKLLAMAEIWAARLNYW